MPEPLTRTPTENTGREFLLNRPSCPPDDQIGQGAELNLTECQKIALNASPTASDSVFIISAFSTH